MLHLMHYIKIPFLGRGEAKLGLFAWDNAMIVNRRRHDFFFIRRGCSPLLGSDSGSTWIPKRLIEMSRTIEDVQHEADAVTSEVICHWIMPWPFRINCVFIGLILTSARRPIHILTVSRIRMYITLRVSFCLPTVPCFHSAHGGSCRFLPLFLSLFPLYLAW